MWNGGSILEHDEQSPLAVYDFIYRDKYRIESFYAQVFGGRSLSLEKTQSVRKQREWSAKATLGIAAVERRAPDEISETSKEVIDPHDTATIDVLQWLSQNEYIADSVDASSKGHFIRLNGSLLLVDRRIMVATSKTLLAHAKGGNATRDMKIGAELFANYPMPSIFVLRVNRRDLYAGTLLDDGLDHLLSSHTWKFGPQSMENVFVIGTVESAQTDESGLEPLAPVLNIAKTMHNWFPATAVRLTPLVMYRRLISATDEELWNNMSESAVPTSKPPATE